MDFLRFAVTNKPDHKPENLIAYYSDFDELGQIYTPFAGTDPDLTQRTKYRNFIKSYLLGSDSNASDIEASMAQRIYRDLDWITKTISGATIGE